MNGSQTAGSALLQPRDVLLGAMQGEKRETDMTITRRTIAFAAFGLALVPSMAFAQQAPGTNDSDLYIIEEDGQRTLRREPIRPSNEGQRQPQQQGQQRQPQAQQGQQRQPQGQQQQRQRPSGERQMFPTERTR